MTPDRAEDAHAVLAEYRRRWQDRPHRSAYFEAVAAGDLVLQQIWNPSSRDIDFITLCSGVKPSILLIDDEDGLGPTGWAAARDARAWARGSVIISPPAMPTEAAETALYGILASGAIARIVVVETPASVMSAWSNYLCAKRSPVWLIAGVEPVLAGMGARH